MSVAIPVYNAMPFARNGLKNTIPLQTTAPGRASMNKGFPAETMSPITSGGVPPSGQDFNGILNQLSTHQVFLNAGGLYRFNASFATEAGGYAAGAVLQLEDGLSAVICTQDNNQNNPNSNMLGWKPFGGKLLEDRIAALENKPPFEDILVGDVFFSMNSFASGAEVAAHKGYGTWERLAQGRFIVGSGTATDSRYEERYFALGETGGEYRHQLAVDEMPSHKHAVELGDAITSNEGHSISSGGGVMENFYENESMATTGGDMPHNNVPPYLAMSIWKRIA